MPGNDESSGDLFDRENTKEYGRLIRHHEKQEALLRRMLWRAAQIAGGGFAATISVIGVLYAVYNGISTNYRTEQRAQNETLFQIKADLEVVKVNLASMQRSSLRAIERLDARVDRLERQVIDLMTPSLKKGGARAGRR